ncbi:protein, clustered with ribosomal protein l32p [hydrocarbon metagenome]|uniref:Protein, clustered with ribosomal protein l32p n=1 Tax=hydrocarbon metagenome TaxID=938273 RepID=A0A0W8E325_9ZZZZ
MKVNLKSLQMRTMDSEEFHLSAQGRDSFLSDIGGRFLEPVVVDLLIENTDNMFIGRGKVSTTIALTCGRCLEEFKYPITTDLTLTVSESSGHGEDGEVIVLEDSQAEIMPRIEEEIFSLIPLNPLCSEECKGLCPFCGVNRNLTTCSCGKNDIDPRWEKLKQLKK